jgi:hypothetical protein
MPPTIVERRFRTILKLIERHPDRWSDVTLFIALRARGPTTLARLKMFLDDLEVSLHLLTISNSRRRRR